MKKNILIFSLLVVASLILMSMRTIDLANLYNYTNTNVPDYINVDNTPENNQITDEIATLGRVLFYDKQLSLNNTTSCGSCHIQEFAFGDTAVVSTGFNGELTERHSPRLINISYNRRGDLFWDSSAYGVEMQPEITLANSIEMGFSGMDGQPALDSLINRLMQIHYYQILFEFAFGDDEITIDRLNKSLAQFVRSIVSFDAKFDEGITATGGDPFTDFPNFTEEENNGKTLFISPPPPPINPETNPNHPPVTVFGCSGCHSISHFSFTKLGGSGNNGVIGVAGDPDAIDTTVDRSPTLRDLVNPQGLENGPFMHDGSLKTIEEVMEHYSLIPKNPENTNQNVLLGGDLEHDRFMPMSDGQVLAVEAFLNTLTGNDVYINPKWSNPFNADGTLTITSNCNNSAEVAIIDLPVSVTNDESVFLTATPEGGVFSGPGVVFSVFNPSVVLPGFHKITYTYTNEEGCSTEVSENIFVTAIIYNFVNYAFSTLSPKIVIGINVTEDDYQPVIVASLNGQILFESNRRFNKGNQKFTIDANGWPKGIYFVKIGEFSKPEKVYVY